MQQQSIDHAQKLMTVFRAVVRNFRRSILESMQDSDFTLPQIMLIGELCESPDITLVELSDRLHLSKSTVSGIVDRLEARGVVSRERPKENRRIVKLSLTSEFLKNNDIQKLKEQYFQELLENIEPEEVEKILYGLEKLNELMLSSSEKKSVSK